MTTKELENYEPKGQLEGFPKEIIARMLDYQEEQGDKRDVTVFENNIRAAADLNGFSWNKTKEGYWFWNAIFNREDFDLFFKKYPKQDNQYSSQEFKVGDKVIDIISEVRGKVTHIEETLNKDSYPVSVEFNDNEEAVFTLDGRYYPIDKRPRLLHYRDDYNYDVIDFNNLPKRQEPKRWRAEVGKIYYCFTSRFKIKGYREVNDLFDDESYDSGNYFQTEEEAQEVADELNEYLKQLINTKLK